MMQTQQITMTTLTDLTKANIPSNYSRIIGRELALQEQDLPKLLQFTRLSYQQLMREDTLLTTEQQIQILHNALHLSDTPDLGLRLGRHLTPSAHGAVGFLASSSPNLQMALEALRDFLPTRMSFVHLELHVNDSMLSCEVHFDIVLQPVIHRLLSETFAVTFYACAAFIVGRPVVEASAYFSHKQPNYSDYYASFLPGKYTFAASNLTVEIPLATCHIPNASANHDSYVLAMQQCEKILAHLQSQHSQKYSTTYHIQKIMLSHPLSARNEEDIAAALFISKRTLARRLKKEGTNFRHIRDRILSQQASSYLRSSDLSVDAIATLLNYHDSANFRRAFKRWFNTSPSDYRQQNLR